MTKRVHLRKDNIRPSIAVRLLALLAMLFLASVGLIFGRIYLLSVSPLGVQTWLEPVSFWIVVVLLVAFAVAMVAAIYVLSTRQRNWIRINREHGK